MLTSKLLETFDEKKEKESLVYSADEKRQCTYIYEYLRDAYEQQNMPLDEFDGESLVSTCQQNRLASNSYLTPIMNDGEVRVVTGTTEGKVDSIFNSVFNQNLQTEVKAFNEYDIQDYQLGDSLTKMVDKSKIIEREEDFLESLLREILAMPAVFVQEVNEEQVFFDRVLEEGDWDDLWQFKIPKFKKDSYLVKREPKKVLWTAEQVFLADIRLPARLLNNQHHIITYRTRTYEEARAIYGNSPRWKYVKPGMPMQNQYKNVIESSEWRFTNRLKSNEVEEIIYKSLSDDEMQVILAGVPMLPVGCPYFSMGRFNSYDMVMCGMKSIHPKFAYFRPIVSMTKVMQALKDEDFRLTVLQRRQQIWQPIVTMAQTILSKDMWLPASITYGISKSQIDSLVDKNQQIDNQMSDMIDSEIEKFINVSSLFQGLDGGQKMTAQEVAQRMKQALIGLGNALTGYMRAVRDCGYLRLYNILNNYTKPIDTRYNDFLEKSEEIYRTYTIDEVDLYDGKTGTEIISFIDRQLLPEESDLILKQEEESRSIGKPKAHTFINVKKLMKIPYLFYINVIQSEKRSSLLEREMFKKDMTDSVEFGQMVGLGVNGEYATQEWAKRTPGLDPKKLYVVPQPQAIPTAPNQEAPTPNSPKMSMKQVMSASSQMGNR